MTKEEIIKKFPFAGNSGECISCAYFEICDKMLPGFIRPRKCGGPFFLKLEISLLSYERISK